LCKSFAIGAVLIFHFMPVERYFFLVSLSQYILIPGTQKLPSSSSLLNHQNCQSDAHICAGSFVCNYCSNSVWFFVPGRLFSRLSCWCVMMPEKMFGIFHQGSEFGTWLNTIFARCSNVFVCMCVCVCVYHVEPH
jgi:hypothetical protein